MDVKSPHRLFSSPPGVSIDSDCGSVNGAVFFIKYLLSKLCPGRRKEVRLDGPCFRVDVAADHFFF